MHSLSYEYNPKAVAIVIFQILMALGGKLNISVQNHRANQKCDHFTRKCGECPMQK